jgi:PTS system ascorbate-specific IIB component
MEYVTTNGAEDMRKKIIIVCNSGLGTSLMIRIHVQHILSELGVLATVEHTDLSSVSILDADIIIGAAQVIDTIEVPIEVEKIPLANIIDREYIKEKLCKSKIFLRWKSL